MHYKHLMAPRYEQIWNLSKWRNEDFNPRMLLFSVGNGAMNAPHMANVAMNSSAILATAQ